MNHELIQKLADQAGIGFQFRCCPQANTAFAQLIIQEAGACVRQYVLNNSGLNEDYQGQVLAEQTILKHFGIN